MQTRIETEVKIEIEIEVKGGVGEKVEVWRVGRWHLGRLGPLRLVGAEFSLSQAECQVEDSHAGSTSLMHVQVCTEYTRIYLGRGGGLICSLRLEVWGLVGVHL
jgi:hypothetical protein